MPNWCNNTVRLTHEDPAMIIRARDALTRGEFFSEFVPIPAYEKDNWYAFCVREWGTKWDVESYGEPDITDDGLTLNCGFDSAWSPPVQAYRKLEEQGFQVEALYYEPSMGFCGEYIDGGEETYEIPGTADEVDSYIPEHINEAFAIGENMSNWEQEQEEFDAEPLAEAFDDERIDIVGQNGNDGLHYDEIEGK